MNEKCRILEGKTAVVIGAAQGLGEALTRRLSKEGCKAIVADIDLEKAEEAAASLEDAKAFKVDVTMKYRLTR